jgi:hypothetical protein
MPILTKNTYCLRHPEVTEVNLLQQTFQHLQGLGAHQQALCDRASLPRLPSFADIIMHNEVSYIMSYSTLSCNK